MKETTIGEAAHKLGVSRDTLSQVLRPQSEMTLPFCGVTDSRSVRFRLVCSHKLASRRHRER